MDVICISVYVVPMPPNGVCVICIGVSIVPMYLNEVSFILVNAIVCCPTGAW